MAMNLAPSSDEDFFLASAKARSVPRGVAVMSGMRKVSTEPICFPLTHSSCSMVTSGCTCAEGHLNAAELDEVAAPARVPSEGKGEPEDGRGPPKPAGGWGGKEGKRSGEDGGAGSRAEGAQPGSGHLCRCSMAHLAEVVLGPGLGSQHGHQEQEDRCEPRTPTARPAAQRSPESARLCPHHCFLRSPSTDWSPVASRQLTSIL